MGTKRGLERLIFFTDAVAAIAITLLVLPLVDLVTNLHETHPDFPDDPGKLLGENWLAIAAFIISFIVIARLWISHHSMFEHVDNYNAPLFVLTIAWSFTIVLLPFPTAIIWTFSPNRVTIAFYIGTMALNSILLTVMTYLIKGNPAIESKSNPVTRETISGSLMATITFLLALVIALIFPSINYFALALFGILGPLEGVLSRRRRERAKKALHA